MTQSNPESTLVQQASPLLGPGAVIDLDQQRRVRAAAREGKKAPIVIRLEGEAVATLPVELPLDVFTPLRALDADLSLVLRQIIAAYRANKAGNGETAANEMEMVVDVLAANPDLPISVLDVLTDVSKRLLSQEGYDALMGKRPTLPDLRYLVAMAMEFYGVTLGESPAPSDSPTSGGETSNETSSTSPEALTPGASGVTETTPTSSGSAAS